MAEHEMPTVAREFERGARAVFRACRPADRRGVELPGKRLVESLQRPEALEALGVARGVGVPPGDDVAPVLAVRAGGVEELPATGQRLGQFVPECPCDPSREPPLAVRERQNHIVAISLDAGRFLDQPPGDRFLYPQWMSGVTS